MRTETRRNQEGPVRGQASHVGRVWRTLWEESGELYGRGRERVGLSGGVGCVVGYVCVSVSVCVRVRVRV